MNKPWKVLASSVQGMSHTLKNVPCQDAHGYKCLDNGTLILAVADGAGSAERSQEGSASVVTTSIDYLEKRLTTQLDPNEPELEEIMKQTFREALSGILLKAKQDGVSPRHFASTLTIVCLLEDRLLTGQLGDGIAVAEWADGEMAAITTPQNGEYANETFFLTSESILEHVSVNIYKKEVRSLALLTDGIIRLAIDMTTRQPFVPLFSSLFEAARQPNSTDDHLASYLGSEKVVERTDDDKTLILAVILPDIVE